MTGVVRHACTHAERNVRSQRWTQSVLEGRPALARCTTTRETTRGGGPQDSGMMQVPWKTSLMWPLTVCPFFPFDFRQLRGVFCQTASWEIGTGKFFFNFFILLFFEWILVSFEYWKRWVGHRYSWVVQWKMFVLTNSKKFIYHDYRENSLEKSGYLIAAQQCYFCFSFVILSLALSLSLSLSLCCSQKRVWWNFWCLKLFCFFSSR